jgi:hypothetical protein
LTRRDQLGIERCTGRTARNSLSLRNQSVPHTPTEENAVTTLTPTERTLRAQIAAHESWAHTPDRAARTAPARRAMFEKFESEVDPDGTLLPAELALRAENARKAHFKRLALKSAQARRRRGPSGRCDQARPMAGAA